MKREQKKNIENFEKLIEEKKKIPKNVKEKINSKAFENIAFAAIIIVYLAALYFGMINIPTDVYITILKILSIILLITTIITYEIGYKKDNGEVWLHGVEIMIIAIFTLYLIYLYSIYYTTFLALIISASIIYLIYYAIKIVVIQRRIEKEYKNSLTDIGEIVKK